MQFQHNGRRVFLAKNRTYTPSGVRALFGPYGVTDKVLVEELIRYRERVGNPYANNGLLTGLFVMEMAQKYVHDKQT